MESEMTNAKPYRGGHGQVSAADAYTPKVVDRGLSGITEMQNLNGIVLDRRGYHHDRVSQAYANLTNALDAAADDGFNFVQVSSAPQNTLRSMDATIPQPVRIPRLYEVEINSQYNPPI